MKESPVLFNSDMVRAILEGRKTETRRVIKDQPNYNLKYGQTHKDLERNILRRCPYGQPGDQLWVRETFCPYPEESTGRIYYRASHETQRDRAKTNTKLPKHLYNWKPSIYMPRTASRITLEITEIQVERVQDITEEEALAERVEYRTDGMFGAETGNKGYVDYHKMFSTQKHPSLCVHKKTAKESFHSLWDSIYKNWDDNPWVFVIKFKRIEV